MAGSTAAPRRLRTYTRPRVSLLYVLRRTLHRLFELQVWDVAAAMTFFGALSLLPTVVALLSVVSLLGVEEETVDAAAHLAAEIWPSLTPDVVREWILTLGSAGPGTGAVVLGAVGTVVSASGAVAAFHRAMHRIHDTREGRPFLHFRLVVFVETLALMLGAVLITILVVVGGDLSLRLGQAVGLPEETVQTWNVVKWPVILVVIALIVTLAYRLGPSAIGVLALAWVACIVLLAGAAFDAEVLRARQLAVGIDASVEIQLATRHTAVLEASERYEARNRRLARLVADAVRAGEDLTIEATPLLSEEGRLLAVESGRRDPEDVSSGSPFHADPVSDDGARLEPTSRPDD